ncbi:MAG: hypothetical protein DI563_11510 [Variovorax paradoxus]|uniref:Uncharacterized protein n=1 Tax=Variovorax paradoxus TaxID=34073 RepID=A0A2W5QBI2_VARPD|nr:MAG: hypothetical protein DI563_11510 [Variovorax paradoxus]
MKALTWPDAVGHVRGGAMGFAHESAMLVGGVMERRGLMATRRIETLWHGRSMISTPATAVILGTRTYRGKAEYCSERDGGELGELHADLLDVLNDTSMMSRNCGCLDSQSTQRAKLRRG